MSRCTLDIDNREGLVLAHTEELSAIQYEKKQLTVGDYIVRADNVIIAVIERKSLNDYAASLKDARMNNTAKLLALRAKTACRVIYLIECPKGGIPTDDTKKFANIAFGSIRSSIYHLMLNYGVMILWTIGTLGTAQELVKFVRSAETLLAKVGDATFLTQAEPLPTEDLAIDLDELTKRHEKSDLDVVREMWSCFSGITTDSADDYIAKWSIHDIITSAIPRTEIAAMKLSNRRAVSKNVVNALLTIGPVIETKLLSCVPGISTRSANDILYGRNLREVITSPLATVAGYTTGKKGTRLGELRAGRILAIFTYKKAAAAAAAVLVAAAPTAATDVPPIHIDDAVTSLSVTPPATSDLAAHPISPHTDEQAPPAPLPPDEDALSGPQPSPPARRHRGPAVIPRRTKAK